MNSNIYELMGIIKGINYDNVINQLEITKLREWVFQNQHNKTDPNVEKMIDMINNILDDGIIDDEERVDLLKLSSTYLMENESVSHALILLNGIIEGIISDNVVNAEEIYMLSAWLKNHSILKGHKGYDLINSLVALILIDGEVTIEEQNQLLDELKKMSYYSMMNLKLDYLQKKVLTSKNIGLDLIDMLEDSQLITYIHRAAENKMRRILCSSSGYIHSGSELVFISLSLIALMNYDGSFYSHVEEIYSNLFKQYSNQRIQASIRSIINRYSRNMITDSERIINSVLENAIVPLPYLPSFYDFVNDIYKINFNYDLDQLDIASELHFIYDGLSKSINDTDDNLSLNVSKKTYKLIKTTKSLIIDPDKRSSIVQLTQNVLKVLDKYYWKKDNIQIYNTYYRTGFEVWKKRQRGNLKDFRNRTVSGNRGHFQFYLQDKQVKLCIPKFKIKSYEQTDKLTLIIKNGKKVICDVDHYIIREIIGGYQIEFDDLELNCPLGNLNASLYHENRELYSSEGLLYRDYLLFDDNGNEIKTKSNYKGKIYILCQYTNDPSIHHILDTHMGTLGFTEVTSQTVLEVNGQSITFKKEMKPNIYGQRVYEAYILENEKRVYPVYRYISLFVFESELSYDQLYVKLNGKKMDLSDFEYEHSIEAGIHKYIVLFQIEKQGMYELRICESINGRTISGGVFTFAIDQLDYNTTMIDDNHYEYQINTYFDIPETGTIVITEYNDMHFRFQFNQSTYQYYIPFNIAMYQIDQNGWNPMSQYIWINDIENESIMYYQGFHCDEVRVNDINGNKIGQLEIKEKGYYHYVTIGLLYNYKNSGGYSDIQFIKRNCCVATVRCYFLCMIDKDATTMEYNSEAGIFNVNLLTYGEGNLWFSLFDSKGDIIEKSKVPSDLKISVTNVPTFQMCKLIIEDKPKGFTLKKSRVVFEKEFVLYSLNGLEDRMFKVDFIDLERYSKKGVYYETCKILGCYVKFILRKSGTDFVGEIYRKIHSEYLPIEKLNPVEIEVLSDIQENYVDLAITKDGDGLLYNRKKHKLLSELEDETAPDIFSYRLNLKEVK